MSNNVSESKIYKSLALVKHPEIQNRNLVELGFNIASLPSNQNIINRVIEHTLKGISIESVCA